MTTKKKTARAPKARAEKAPAAPMEAPVYSMDGATVSTIRLPAEVFGAPWRSDLVHQVATGMQANRRQNRAHTKDRSEVSGGGKKPWKQKGTGQARHGSTRSPIWRHGGVTFGPRAERDYGEKLGRKMRAGALASVLSRKAKDGELILVDKLSFETPKTAAARATLAALGKSAHADALTAKKKNAALVALPSYDANAVKSFRNLGAVMTEETRNLNVVDVLAHKYLILVDPTASFTALAGRVKK